MTRPGRFAGRHVLVTGSTGMAASAARAIAAEGGAVFAVSRTEAHLRTLEDEVEAAFVAFHEHFGRVDAVYGVAGISGRRYGDGPIHEATLEGWEAVLAANATSQFLVARAAVRRMLAPRPDDHGQRGTILLMSSTLATHAYAASKGAIDALVRSLAAYYAPHGIRVNGIAPALVATPMSRRAQDDPTIVGYLAEKQPLARGPIDADAVTATALHLLGDEARMVTGQVVAVDGGWTVGEPRPGQLEE